MAFAKWLGVYWEPTINTFKGRADVAGCEVRARTHHSYELLVRNNDLDDRPYVLLTGLAPDFLIRGWLFGREAKRPEWLRDYGGNRQPAYFVPTPEICKDWEQLRRYTRTWLAAKLSRQETLF
jgi:hypothetical protein